MKPSSYLLIAGVAVNIFIMISLTSAWGEELKLFRINTGGLTGVYYPIGKLIAQGLTDIRPQTNDAQSGEYGVPGYIGVAQNSAGSIENVRSVVAGDSEAGLVQADIAALALNQEGKFKGEKQALSLRAVASLYPEKFQIVVRRDAGVHSVYDFKRKRISIDEIGSGTLSVMQIVLKAHGLSEKDFKPVYLKPVFTQDKMITGELQGFVIMAGVPVQAITRLVDIGISIVPIEPEVAFSINRQFPYLSPGILPGNVYPGVPETQTLDVYALLVVSSHSPEDLIYQVTKALWSTRTLDLLTKGHLQGKAIAKETALEGLSIPLHPGAKRFYQERGMIKEDRD